MIPEIGHFALVMALSTALVQAFLPLWGAQTNNPSLMAVAKPAAFGQFLFLFISYAVLTYAFISHDFSVLYVANNSNSGLPFIYLISGVWGAHEGSMLLWVFILGTWTALVALFGRSLPDNVLARVLSVLGFLSIGLILFMLFTSNPFDRLFPAAVDGADLNPLLQDPGMAIHPPMLYMGYVGLAVPFAFAIAALIGGRLDAAWARWSRPWTIMAWSFLTFGIMLGSWWAYYELGWGGWWFWDPVENASFMPWLVATALIHSLAVTEKRGLFRGWTVLLAIIAFSLSLLGTFLVRSGVLTSVHAFATDPERGIFILAFLGIVIGGSLILYAWRMQTLKTVGKFKPLSRETLLLLNNVLLVAAAACILLGTIYPLVIDALGKGKLSVGPPYFNTVFIPLMFPLFLLLGIGPMVRWKEQNASKLIKNLKTMLIVSLVILIIATFVLMNTSSLMVFTGLAVSIWMIVSSLSYLKQRASRRQGLSGLSAIPIGVYGMVLAHIGVAITVMGVTFSSAYSHDHDIRMSPGDQKELAGYLFKFESVDQQQGANYLANVGVFTVLKDGEVIATMKPEKRIYNVRQSVMTEAAIDTALTRDLYISLGQPPEAGEMWPVRLYYKPFISWIWGGGVIMALGGIFAALDRRYRQASKYEVSRNKATINKPSKDIDETENPSASPA
ncbi:MAG: heme lyase CcmF/NrfE family subunit [Gammaproteobacteria bacterium]